MVTVARGPAATRFRRDREDLQIYHISRGWRRHCGYSYKCHPSGVVVRFTSRNLKSTRGHQGRNRNSGAYAARCSSNQAIGPDFPMFVPLAAGNPKIGSGRQSTKSTHLSPRLGRHLSSSLVVELDLKNIWQSTFCYNYMLKFPETILQVYKSQ